MFLAILEGGLALAGYGRNTDFWIPVAHSSDVRTNASFGRSFFPPGLARAPEPTRLATPKKPGVYRIFVIGGSAAMGFPEPAFSFARILETLLEARLPNTEFEVVNSAMTAINSHVALPIVRHSSAYEPDAFLIYLGNNEVVGPYGPGTVFDAGARNVHLLRAAIRLRATRTGQALAALLSPPSRRRRSWQGMEMFLDYEVDRGDPRLQTVYASLEANLDSMIGLARNAGAEVVLSSIAVNLRDSPPFASAPGPTGAAGLFAAARASGSRTAFEQARDEDLLRFRADSRINEAIRRSARRHDVPLIDAEDVFAQASADGVPGDEWFLEHVHFRFVGAWRLALAAAQALEPSLPANPSAVARDEWLTPIEAAARMAYTAWDELRIETQIHEMLRRPPFSLQPHNDDRLRRHEMGLRELAARARAEDTLALYRQALASNPGRISLIRRFAELLADRGNPADAAAEWGRLLTWLPNEPAWLIARGAALRAAGRLLESADDYATTLEADPDNAPAHFGLGATLQALGSANEAEASYLRALALDPGYAEAESNIGLIRLQEEQPVQALERFDAAIEIQPRFPTAHHNRGLALIALGRPSEARAAFSQAIALAPAFADSYFHRGALMASSGRFEEAAPDFVTALEYDPLHAQATAGLAAVWMSRGQFERARELYGKAAGIRPEDPEVRFGLAKALLAMGKPNDAVVELRVAIDLRPDYAEAMNDLATTLALMGRLEESERLLERATILRPDFEPALVNLERVRGMRKPR